MNKKHFTAIVLSAGKGNRMHSDIPKQYMDMQGYPVIYYALKAFEESQVDDIILVTGAEDVAFCTKDIVQKYHFTKVKDVVPGGAERYLSVLEGLKKAQNADYVLIHDGARPFIEQEVIRRAMDEVREKQACIAAMPVKDTIKKVDENGKVEDTPPRKSLYAVQTPQAFSYSLVYDSYRKMIADGREDVTDDAMVVEAYGKVPVYVIEGSYRNFKITTPEDLEMAEFMLNAGEPGGNVS